jgi:hypothetical protein
MGAAPTYARRFALFSMVGIAGEDDLDAPDFGNDQPQRDKPAEGGPNSSPVSALARSTLLRTQPSPPAPEKLGTEESRDPDATDPGDPNPAERRPGDNFAPPSTPPKSELAIREYNGTQGERRIHHTPCRTHHRDNPSFGDEVALWERRAIDPLATSRMLWVSTPQIE